MSLKQLIKAIKELDDGYSINTEIVLSLGFDGRMSLPITLNNIGVNPDSKIKCNVEWCKCNETYKLTDIFEHWYYEVGVTSRHMAESLRNNLGVIKNE